MNVGARAAYPALSLTLRWLLSVAVRHEMLGHRRIIPYLWLARGTLVPALQYPEGSVVVMEPARVRCLLGNPCCAAMWPLP